MSRRPITHRVTLLLLGMTLVVSDAAVASTGGGGLGPGPGASSGSSSAPTSAAGVQSANQSVEASGNGITITTRASALLSNQLRFTGSVDSAAAGETVEIERRGRETGWSWAATAHGALRSDGSFTAVWPVNHIGQFAIRAVLERQTAAASRATATSPAVTITIFRWAIATQYGPGFYGQRTACGQILRPGTLGVASRTLKCGTRVAILWRGRTIVVPVIDRGPYANHADWDLTEATGRALGISGTATIGAVSLSSR